MKYHNKIKGIIYINEFIFKHYLIKLKVYFFSVKTHKFKGFYTFGLRGLIEVFGLGNNESGDEKSLKWTIEGQYVDFPENFWNDVIENQV